ncbi:MAG: PQQ-like beta-propeller repeat protein, partial [Acidobacteria bacterium]|nr:PQQ-like beta-propeller repeat protein [Acidobacteriota bacterium]
FYALDLRTGSLRWKANLRTSVTASPVVAEGVVCIQAGGLVALDIATGKVAWRAALGGSLQSVPVLAGRYIYLSGIQGTVYALE